MVCDKVVWKMMCERWCVTKWCDKDGVWQSGVWKMVCDKVVCQRWCVTKVCVKDGVWQTGVSKRWCGSQPSAISAMPATQNARPCRQVPRLPRKVKIYVAKCHGHANGNQPSAISAMPATQNARPCRQVPHLPRKVYIYVLLLLLLATATSQPRPSGAQARSSSSRRLCVRHLPHESQPRPTAPTRAAAVLRLPHESQPRLSGAHARSSSSRRLCVRRLPHESHTKAYEMSVLCDEWWCVWCDVRAALAAAVMSWCVVWELSAVWVGVRAMCGVRRERLRRGGAIRSVGVRAECCVMSWCESHVWCEMWEAKSVGVRAECCVMSWCESHVWCELVWELSAVWWVGVRAMCSVGCETLRRGGAATGGRKQRRVQSEKQEPHTVMWGK